MRSRINEHIPLTYTNKWILALQKKNWSPTKNEFNLAMGNVKTPVLFNLKIYFRKWSYPSKMFEVGYKEILS